MNALTKSEAQGLADSVPLSEIDLSDTSLYQNDSVWPYLARLRRDDPIHYKEGGIQGNFWSVTRYKDIVAVDTNHQVFSSEGGITLASLLRSSPACCSAARNCSAGQWRSGRLCCLVS